MKKNAIALACVVVIAALLIMPAVFLGGYHPGSAIGGDARLAIQDVSGELRSTDGGSTSEDNSNNNSVAVLDEVDGEGESSADDEPEYAPDAVLVGIAEGVSLAEVNERIASLDYVATRSVSDDDVHFGYVKLDLAEGVEVEDALLRLEYEGFTSSAEPDYIFHLLDDDSADYAAYANDSSPSDDAEHTGDAISTYAPATSLDITAQTTSINDEYSKINAANASTHWMLTAINAYDAWDIQSARANHAVTVAVLDSGVNVNHPDLKDNITGAYSVLNKSTDVTDTVGHGTHVAGIIAGTSNNEIGVAGVSYNAYIMPVQVIQPNRDVAQSDAIAGADYILKHRNDNPNAPVRVVNMSFGGLYEAGVRANAGYSVGDDTPAAFLAAINALQAADILVVCAAGNYANTTDHTAKHGEYKTDDGKTVPENKYIDDTAYKCFPCDFDAEAIGVINLDHSGTGYYRASGSNFNMANQRTKELSAPGTSIYSTFNTGKYGYMSGTSMATPCVSGVAAMLFAAKPSLTSGEARSALINNTTKLSSSTFDLETGYGMVDAVGALKAVVPDAFPSLTGKDKVQVGGTAQLSIVNGSGSWSWSSSDTSIATVSGGVVTGVGAGSAVITATLGNASLSQTVNVYDPTIVGSASVLVGTAVQLAVSPSNPAGTWKWDTSDSSVLQVLNSSAGRMLGKSLGQATVTVTLADDPTITSSLLVNVTAFDIAKATVTGVEDQVYTGSPITLPNLDVRVYSTAGNTTGYTSLVEGTDYEVSYANNTETGTATVIIRGIGEYAGEHTDTFRIAAYSLEDSGIIESAQLNQASATYTGKAIEPGVTIKVKGREESLAESTDGGVTGDYIVKYSNNVNAGEATVTVTGINDFIGTLSGSFTIKPVSITSEDIAVSNVAAKTYTGSELTQSPKLTYNGMTLVQGTDYELSYDKNVDAGTATMKIRGLGNYATYTGFYPIYYDYVYRTEAFAIEPADISGAAVSIGSATYNGSEQKLEPTVTFNGMQLSAPNDYTLSYPSANYTNAGAKTVVINGKGNFKGTKTAGYSIGKKSATITANSVTKTYDGVALTAAAAGATVNGFVGGDKPVYVLNGSITNVGSTPSVVTCDTSAAWAANYNVKVTNGTLKVNAAPISSCTITLSPTSMTYTGGSLRPTVTVKHGSTTLTQGSSSNPRDYTVSYKNNVAIGIATATVAGAGNYAGSKDITFTIARPSLETYSGSSRYETAQKIASAAASSSSSVKGIIVVACDGDKFPDALSAAGLSGVLNYPVVAINGQGLTSADRSALEAMQKKCSSGSLEILIAGGTSAVSSGVQSALSRYGKVSRPFGGSNRYDTNRLMYEYGVRYGKWETSQVFLASGLSFPDALTIAPYLTYAKAPIVLVDPSASSLSTAQCKMVANASQVVALGGTSAVPDSLLSAASQASSGKSSNRLGGANRYVTSSLIVNWELSHGMTLEGAGVATGNAFPDALASSYLLGKERSVLMLADPSGGNSNMAAVVKSSVTSNGSPALLRVFGGAKAVPSSVRSQFASAAGWPSYTTIEK